jgi:hypothetical protein
MYRISHFTQMTGKGLPASGGSQHSAAAGGGGGSAVSEKAVALIISFPSRFPATGTLPSFTVRGLEVMLWL